MMPIKWEPLTIGCAEDFLTYPSGRPMSYAAWRLAIRELYGMRLGWHAAKDKSWSIYNASVIKGKWPRNKLVTAKKHKQLLALKSME